MEQHEQEEEEERREEEDNNSNNNTYDEYDEKAAYHVARSVDRCCEHLAHLRAQLARHSTSLDQLLQAQTQTQTQTRLSPNNRYSVKAPPPATTNNATSTSPTTTTTEKPPMPRGSEARAQDRQARVERLRKTGWQRRRFDASPYEALCEAVLAEMA
jgi:hypothetical protein